MTERKISQKAYRMKAPSRAAEPSRAAKDDPLARRLGDLNKRVRDEPGNPVVQGAARELESAIQAGDYAQVGTLLDLIDREPRGFGLGIDGIYRPPSLSQQRQEREQQQAAREREEQEAERLLGRARYGPNGMWWELPDA